MNDLDRALNRTRKSLAQVCIELGISEDDCIVETVDTCSSCGIWTTMGRLTKDLDDNPICKECLQFYGK